MCYIFIFIFYSLKYNNKGTCKVICNKELKFLWEDVLSSKSILCTGNMNFISLACQDCSIYVYSQNGRRIFPAIVVESPISMLACNSYFLMCLTTQATVYVWNIFEKSPVIIKEKVVQPSIVSKLIKISVRRKKI